MHFERVVTFHQHIAAPITDADDERVDLEIGGWLPRAEDFQDSLLCIFVLDGRTLLTLIPSDHVLHSINSSFTRVRFSGLVVGKVYAWGPTRVERYSDEFVFWEARRDSRRKPGKGENSSTQTSRLWTG